jgi:23S rRNA pseudouridine1911/1915/1917 synthase
MLHAEVLGFVHPVSKEEMNFSAPIPPDMQSVLETLRSLRG